MDFDSQAKILEQRRNRYLQQQDTQAPDGQMVGGHYVAANPLEYLAAGLRGYGGMRGEQLANKELTDLQGKKQQAISQALRTFGEKANPSQAGTGATNLVNDALPPEMQIGAQPQLAPRKPDMYGAYGALAESGIPQLQQMGTQGMINMPQVQAQQQEREDARTFRQQEAQAARDARAQELQMRMQDQRTSQQEKLQAQRELQQMQIDARKDMQRVIASTRQAPQAQIIQTDTGPMQLVGGRAMPIVGPDGKPVSAPKKGAAGLSATAQKELFEADDAVQNGMGAVSSLQKALELNKDAYSGVGAATRATIASNLPGQYKGADATIAMENIIKDQALTSMKSIFGGNPTEGERAILLDLQASASKTPKQREEILGRAMQAAQRRLNFNQQKADALRSGTYMSDGVTPNAAPAQTAPKRLKFDAQGNIVP